MLTLRHYQPYAPLAAVVRVAPGVTHLLPVITVEARIDGDRVEHHPIVIRPDGELSSLHDWRQDRPRLDWRIDLQARLTPERRAELERELAGAGPA